jgi:hypothetical protein
MKRVAVTKISVGSLAKTVGVAQAVFAFVIGLISTIMVAAGAIDETSSFIATLGVSLVWLGFGIILYPLFFFVIGWLQGAVAAIILNFIFAESGGLIVHTNEEPLEKVTR